jgi:hypothetical protein
MLVSVYASERLSRGKRGTHKNFRMTYQPRLLPLLFKEATSTSFGATPIGLFRAIHETGCCWPRYQNALFMPFRKPLTRRFLTSTHLAPSFVSRGWLVILKLRDCSAVDRLFLTIFDSDTSNRIYKDPSSLRLSSWRPRAKRDFTVPTLILSATAISS